MSKKMKETRVRLKKILMKKGFYDTSPDTNIERLEKKMVDLAIKKKPELIKELEKTKKEAKEKPIRTSLLCVKR